MGIFIGLLSLYTSGFVVQLLDMKLISTIMGQVLGVGVVALLIIFQQEIRHFLLRLGNHTFIGRKKNGTRRSLFKYKNMDRISPEVLEEITSACRSMAGSKTGALIVLKHESSLATFIYTGDTINADINRRLIENLFFKNSPLHDGAVIMTPDKILAARGTLPVSKNMKLDPHYGMRHKAALGITEDTDADAIVVSEETGSISFVTDGKIKTMESINELRLAIEESYR